VDKNSSTSVKTLNLTLPAKTNTNNLGIYTYSTPVDLFGVSGNKNKFCSLIITNTGSSTIYFTGMKLEY
jgi:hypothetical protein